MNEPTLHTFSYTYNLPQPTVSRNCEHAQRPHRHSDAHFNVVLEWCRDWLTLALLLLNTPRPSSLVPHRLIFVLTGSASSNTIQLLVSEESTCSLHHRSVGGILPCMTRHPSLVPAFSHNFIHVVGSCCREVMRRIAIVTTFGTREFGRNGSSPPTGWGKVKRERSRAYYPDRGFALR